jgi:hypothetical protein
MQMHKTPLMLNLNMFTHYIYTHYTKNLKYIIISIVIKNKTLMVSINGGKEKLLKQINE